MDVRVGLQSKLSTKELMVLNWGVAKDSWESLGQPGDPTSPSKRKSVLNIHWKDWCWTWISSMLAPWCKELIGKDPDSGKDWRQEEKGMIEDEMIGWHHWLDGYEFEQAPGVGDGQGGLACCSPCGHKELDMTEQLNWTGLNHVDGASQMAQWKEFGCSAGDCFSPWVGKIPWRRAWQPIPIFFPGKCHEQRSLAGYNQWAHEESHMTEQEHTPTM